MPRRDRRERTAPAVGGEHSDLGEDDRTTEETVSALVAFASTVFTLLPGDVILAGPLDTPATVVAGDTVTMSIEGIGALVNPVVRPA